MPLEMKEVYSSWIAQIGYDADTRELHYVTQKGVRIVHTDVPPEEAARVGAFGGVTPPSIGEALHAHVRGRYAHRAEKPDE